MDPATLIPTPDALQVHWSIYKVLLILTFYLHILFMNVMLGGGMIALVGAFKNTPPARAVGRDMSVKLPFTVAFTVNFGVAPLLFIQVLYGHFIYSSSVLMGLYWLSVVGLVILAYAALYLYDFKFEGLGCARTLVVGAAVVCLLLTAFILTNNMTLMLRPETWTGYFKNPGGTMLNWSDPTLIPRYLHFVTAAAAVGGLSVSVIWKTKGGRGDPEINANIACGLKWFTYATLVQVLVGVWFLIALPRDIMLLFMGQSALHTGLFLIGLALVVLSLVFGFKKALWPATASALALILVMVLMRDLVRSAYLNPYFSPGDLAVKPQYSPFVMFGVTFVVGLAIVAYMLKTAADAVKEG